METSTNLDAGEDTVSNEKGDVDVSEKQDDAAEMKKEIATRSRLPLAWQDFHAVQGHKMAQVDDEQRRR